MFKRIGGLKMHSAVPELLPWRSYYYNTDIGYSSASQTTFVADIF